MPVNKDPWWETSRCKAWLSTVCRPCSLQLASGQSLQLAAVPPVHLSSSRPASTRARHRRMVHSNPPLATNTRITIQTMAARMCTPGRVRLGFTGALAPWADLKGWDTCTCGTRKLYPLIQSFAPLEPVVKI